MSTNIPTVKPVAYYRFHLKNGKTEDAVDINPGDALLWSGYQPHEVAWFEARPDLAAA